jgi:succinate dehydrogenase / fumarate reductase iron-sulfur subunit
MRLTLEIWRQASAAEAGSLVTYEMDDVSEHMSFLEMLDVLNERLTREGEEPVAFEHDCREGICGSCGVMIDGVAHGPFGATATIDGVAHGPFGATATCQLHMRRFSDGDRLRIEPWRARAFPVIKDLVVDRAPLDEIIQSGGFVSVNTGSAPEANLIPVAKPLADQAMDAASCIGCGACVAQCPNGAAQLFTAAKVSHLVSLPQGQPERGRRVVRMVETMEEYFGSCSNFRECEAVCPKEISIDFIGRMNHEYLRASLSGSD